MLKIAASIKGSLIPWQDQKSASIHSIHDDGTSNGTTKNRVANISSTFRNELVHSIPHVCFSFYFLFQICCDVGVWKVTTPNATESVVIVVFNTRIENSLQ